MMQIIGVIDDYGHANVYQVNLENLKVILTQIISNDNIYIDLPEEEAKEILRVATTVDDILDFFYEESVIGRSGPIFLTELKGKLI